MADPVPTQPGVLAAAAQSVTAMWTAVLSSITARIGNAPTAALLGAVLAVAVTQYYQDSLIRPWLEDHNFTQHRSPKVITPQLVCNDGSERVLAQMQVLSVKLADSEQRIGARLEEAIQRTVRPFDTTVQVRVPPKK